MPRLGLIGSVVGVTVATAEAVAFGLPTFEPAGDFAPPPDRAVAEGSADTATVAVALAPVDAALAVEVGCSATAAAPELVAPSVAVAVVAGPGATSVDAVAEGLVASHIPPPPSATSATAATTNSAALDLACGIGGAAVGTTPVITSVLATPESRAPADTTLAEGPETASEGA